MNKAFPWNSFSDEGKGVPMALNALLPAVPLAIGRMRTCLQGRPVASPSLKILWNSTPSSLNLLLDLRDPTAPPDVQPMPS